MLSRRLKATQMNGSPAAILAAALMCGCAQTARHAVAPATGPLATTQPSGPPEAFLPLDEIRPRPVLADLIKPASNPTTAPSTRPSLDALELYARARGAMLENNHASEINLLERAIQADPGSFALRYA